MEHAAPTLKAGGGEVMDLDGLVWLGPPRAGSKSELHVRELHTVLGGVGDHVVHHLLRQLRDLALLSSLWRADTAACAAARPRRSSCATPSATSCCSGWRVKVSREVVTEVRAANETLPYTVLSSVINTRMHLKLRDK